MDLLKGERYSNGDWALAGALKYTALIPRLVLSYDINCQYSRNIVSRFTKNISSDTPHLDDMEYVIPKGHIVGHKENCFYQHSLNFTKGCGRTDGEACERNWALLNPLSMSTREMNSAHRHEVLEDHMSHINFTKLMTMRTSFLQSCYDPQTQTNPLVV